MKIDSKTLTLALLSSLALMATGCGQYVSYGDDATAPGSVGPDPVITELGDFPELTRFNHYVFAGLVASFTSRSEDGEYVYFDYVGSSEDVEATYQLDTYLASLATIDPSSLESSEERLAYWFNGYNASVIRGVLEQFEGDTSFQVIGSGVFFTTRAYAFGGLLLSLDQIEQGVIRGDFENANATLGLSEEELAQVKTWHEELWGEGGLDARFHAALNCGALGCPNLLASAPFVFQADKLDAQLAEATTRWLANPEKGAGANGVSMLFTWYEADFVEDAGSVEAFISAHREGGTQGVDLEKSLEYDWTLNTAR